MANATASDSDRAIIQDIFCLLSFLPPTCCSREAKRGRRASGLWPGSHRMRWRLMSSMVKEEYSLSSSGSAAAAAPLRVRMPYMGTDTSWIRIFSSGELSSWKRHKDTDAAVKIKGIDIKKGTDQHHRKAQGTETRAEKSNNSYMPANIYVISETCSAL